MLIILYISKVADFVHKFSMLVNFEK